MSTRSGGRWGSSGVAAMRAEHEAEMTALKEEKQDLLLKYHATSAKLNEEQLRCAELNGEVEEARAQFVSLQVGRLSDFMYNILHATCFLSIVLEKCCP